MNYKTDDYFMEKIDRFLPIFCKLNVHPNYITLIALVLSVGIIFLHLAHFYWAVVFSIIIRQICDCIDGGVARKCNKTSKLGGALDNLADMIMLISISFITFTFVFPNNYTFVFVCSGGVIGSYLIINYFMFNVSYLYDHSYLKDYSDSIYKNCVAFVANNSLIISIALATVYISYIKIFFY
jgi:phosphatidylglycerophosphate synthase